MAFTPPKVDQNVWATYVSRRSPSFKVHSSKGLAHSAVGYHFPGEDVIMYHLENGEWTVYNEFLVPTICGRCQGPFTKNQWGYIELRRPYRKAGMARFNEPVICETCYQAERTEVIRKDDEKLELKKLAELKAKYKDHDND
jgi:hypothetical protein